MVRVPRGWIPALLCSLLAAAPAAAGGLATSIDLNYLYSQENADGDVKATTQYNQKYEIRYETSLTSAYDFAGAVRVELQDVWHTNEANSSRVAPTLELAAKGESAAGKVSYDGVVSTTDPYEESGESKTYSTSLAVDLEFTPVIWPQTKFKYQRRRDYEEWTTDSTTDTVELTLLKDFFSDLRLEFYVKSEEATQVLPERTGSSSIDWSGKAAFKELLWGGTEFETAYEIKESYKESQRRDIFTGMTEDYTQQFRTRLKNSLQLMPRLSVGLGWEYQFDQDLLALTYDYKLKNKYLLEWRWDFVEWFKLMGEARRETDSTFETVGQDDEQTVTDTVRAGFDCSPSDLLRIAGKAEFKFEDKIPQNSGGSVTENNEERYELALRNKYRDFWDLGLNASSANKHTDGWLVSREDKLKGELKLRFLDLGISPTYEVTKRVEWDDAIEDPRQQRQTRDAKIRIEYHLELLDLFAFSFSHEYGIKTEDTLDDVLNFEEVTQLNEDTRFNFVFSEFIRDLRIEAEVERKASDTEGDADPMLVDVSYLLKLDWKLNELGLSSSIKYNDKGDTYDDVSFNTRIGWRGEQLEVTGEYQFDKIYADLTDEKRKLNLKLNYKF